MKEIVKKIIFYFFSALIIRKGKSGAVYITFDDGPHSENTLKILEILRQSGMKATFFMIGSEMDKYPDRVQTVINEGHVIGYHSYGHESLKKMSFSESLHDFNRAKKIEQKFGIKFRYYRPPYGDLTVMGFIMAIIRNWKIVMWSLDSEDSFHNREEVMNIVHPDKISDGEILLFHDDYDLTVDILPAVLGKMSSQDIYSKAL